VKTHCCFVIFFMMAGAAYYAYHPPFWAVPTEFLTDSAAAASIGLINLEI
jgi:hypothetical protein